MLIESLECKKCNEDLEFELSLDDEDDLFIFVEPCKVCVADGVQAGIDEGQRRKNKKLTNKGEDNENS